MALCIGEDARSVASEAAAPHTLSASLQAPGYSLWAPATLPEHMFFSGFVFTVVWAQDSHKYWRVKGVGGQTLRPPRSLGGSPLFPECPAGVSTHRPS